MMIVAVQILKSKKDIGANGGFVVMNAIGLCCITLMLRIMNRITMEMIE